MKNITRFILLGTFLFSTSEAFSKDYCVAIRGNGELAAAHWSSFSRLAEEFGLPKAMAGGSSATVTMMFVESVAANRMAQKLENKQRAQSLLLKSIPEFTTVMAEHDGLLSAYDFMSDLAQNKNRFADKTLERLSSLDAGSVENAQKVFQKYAPLINPELINGLVSNPLQFRVETKKSIEVFGKFDAQSDTNLFFRPGLVDFKYFAIVLGTVADFYAGNVSPKIQKQMEGFLSQCSDLAYGKQWREIPEKECRSKFRSMVSSYLSQAEFQHIAVFEPVGSHITALPTTSVVRGNGFENYERIKERYFLGDQKEVGSYSIDFQRDLRFGYWGEPKLLDRIRKNLFPLKRAGDLKAQKFFSLGSANWFEVLSTSPAEPGLANFQKIPTGTTREAVLAELSKPLEKRWQDLSYKPAMTSAGGWSDLHPTAILKASGCREIVYLTRKDGDTVFGQQLFIRLLGLQEKVPFWNQIGTQNNVGWKVPAEAQNTPWNRLYNLGNPKSSFVKSIQRAKAVFCTNWNSFDVFKGDLWQMTEDAYKSPILSGDSSWTINGIPSQVNREQYPGCVY